MPMYAAHRHKCLSYRTSCVPAIVHAVQEARRCWKRAEELFQPQHDLLLLLEAQSLLAGVSPPPLGAAGISLASPPTTETPAAATPEPSTAAAQPPSRPQVLRRPLMPDVAAWHRTHSLACMNLRGHIHRAAVASLWPAIGQGKAAAI